MILEVFTDGGSRGNPGLSGCGVVITDNKGNIQYQDSKYLGVKTNNQAEYSGLILALKWLVDHQNGLDAINFSADSQLLVCQLNGQYKVKSPHIKPLYLEAIQLLSTIKIPVKFTHIRRSFNDLADQLANQAMDRRQ
ncbi:MAG: ribonuclease HI family protein [Candidatus Shapirobacteria bacterium]|jgi:ribonuclease HI